MTKSTRLGVFDSGLGGLTVVSALRDEVPDADVLYLGDLARVPYGTRSPDTVRRYAKSCAGHLLGMDIDMLIVACNTVSAVALDDLAAMAGVPVIGVVGPGADAAVQQSESKRIGVLATEGTIASHAYPRAIRTLAESCHVVSLAAPLLVPLVDEGWTDGEVPRLVVRHYVRQLVALGDFDVLVLGCTHYPHLRGLLESELSLLRPGARVVDSAKGVAVKVAKLLAQQPEASAPDGASSMNPVARADDIGGRQEGAPTPPSRTSSWIHRQDDAQLREPRRQHLESLEEPSKLRLLFTDGPPHLPATVSRFLGLPESDFSVEQVDLPSTPSNVL